MINVEDKKFVVTFCKDKFLRAFMRRMPYIYFGLDHDKNTFVLSNTHDSEFKYCDSKQTTGLVKIHNEEVLKKVREWFISLGVITDHPMIFYVAKALTFINNQGSRPWVVKRSVYGEISFSGTEGVDVTVSHPIDSHFTLVNLQRYVNKYSSVFLEGHTPRYLLPIEDSGNKILKLSVPCEELYKQSLIPFRCKPAHLLLFPGIELLQHKPLIQKKVPHDIGIVFWRDGSDLSINYGGMYQDQDITLCTVRDNTFLSLKRLEGEPV